MVNLLTEYHGNHTIVNCGFATMVNYGMFLIFLPHDTMDYTTVYYHYHGKKLPHSTMVNLPVPNTMVTLYHSNDSMPWYKPWCIVVKHTTVLEYGIACSGIARGGPSPSPTQSSLKFLMLCANVMICSLQTMVLYNDLSSLHYYSGHVTRQLL